MTTTPVKETSLCSIHKPHNLDSEIVRESKTTSERKSHADYSQNDSILHPYQL